MSFPAFKKKSGPGIGGTAVPAFSKKPGGVSTVGGGGQRSGFTPHVKTTKLAKIRTPEPKMVGGLTKFKSDSKTTGPLHGVRPTKNGHSGKAAKSVPAFSKKKI